MGMELDQSKMWTAIEERYARTEDPRHRQMLEVVIEHSKAEAARSVERVTERIQGKDGLLDSADQAGQALVDMASNVNNQTLPRLNRAADSVTKTARGLGHAARGLGDNPSALLLGIGPIEPGPGESGYRYKDGKP